MKLTLLSLFLSLSFNIFSQEITEAQRDTYTKVLYKADSIRFSKVAHNAFKFEEYKKDNFFKEVLTQEEISTCSKLAKETAQLNFNENNKLVLSGKLPERLNMQLSGIFSIDLVENGLSKKNGNKFELNPFYNSNSGYGEIKFEIDSKSKYSADEKLNGFVSFKLNYLIGYDQIELTPKDIGKSITLNNCQYTIISIKDNKLVLDKISKQDNELNIINFNKKGEVAKPYSYSKLVEMAKQDSTISMESFNRKNTTVYKMVWNLFEKNPQISYKEFKEILTIQKLTEMKADGKYTIAENIAPLEYKFILYSPKFQSEIIKVEMK